jgi:tetratricopeptide (TPR) repeat protein
MTRIRAVLPVLLLAAFALTFPPRAAAGDDSARSLEDRGLKLYESGDYDGAVDAFNKVLAAGVDDPTVHYNLGNAYFKSGKLGFAILHYRRALELAPRDGDIRANLEYARFLARDSVDPQAATDTRVRDWLDRVTPDEMARLASLLWILAGVVLVVWQLRRDAGRAWRRVGTALLVLWLVAIGTATLVWHRLETLNEAVVLAHEATVRNGPGGTFDTAFVLHEGAEVVVEGERGSWTEVSLPGDLRGWIANDAIGRL